MLWHSKTVNYSDNTSTMNKIIHKEIKTLSPPVLQTEIRHKHISFQNEPVSKGISNLFGTIIGKNPKLAKILSY
jgi:hypothetical protein